MVYTKRGSIIFSLQYHWGSDIFYPLTGTTKKWPESFNNADFGHFTD